MHYKHPALGGEAESHSPTAEKSLVSLEAEGEAHDYNRPASLPAPLLEDDDFYSVPPSADPYLSAPQEGATA
jgi:hypothetical protein